MGFVLEFINIQEVVNICKYGDTINNPTSDWLKTKGKCKWGKLMLFLLYEAVQDQAKWSCLVPNI